MGIVMVITKLYPKDNCENYLIKITENLVEKTLKEEGNINYTFLRPMKGNFFLFLEQWENIDALNKHLSSDHFRLFSKEFLDCSEDLEINVFKVEKLNFME